MSARRKLCYWSMMMRVEEEGYMYQLCMLAEMLKWM